MATLEQLYDAHAKALYGFLINVSRRPEDARDLLQNVFTRLAERPDLLSSVRTPRAYLLRMAHHAWIDLVRRNQSRRERDERFATESPTIFEPTDEDKDLHRFLKRGLGALPEEQRAVVHLRIWEDLSFEAIGQTLEIPKSTAVSRFRYALEKLRAHLPSELMSSSSTPWASELPTSENS